MSCRSRVNVDGYLLNPIFEYEYECRKMNLGMSVLLKCLSTGAESAHPLPPPPSVVSPATHRLTPSSTHCGGSHCQLRHTAAARPPARQPARQPINTRAVIVNIANGGTRQIQYHQKQQQQQQRSASTGAFPLQLIICCK